MVKLMKDTFKSRLRAGRASFRSYLRACAIERMRGELLSESRNVYGPPLLIPKGSMNMHMTARKNVTPITMNMNDHAPNAPPRFRLLLSEGEVRELHEKCYHLISHPDPVLVRETKMYMVRFMECNDRYDPRNARVAAASKIGKKYPTPYGQQKTGQNRRPSNWTRSNSIEINK